MNKTELPTKLTNQPIDQSIEQSLDRPPKISLGPATRQSPSSFTATSRQKTKQKKRNQKYKKKKQTRCHGRQNNPLVPIKTKSVLVRILPSLNKSVRSPVLIPAAPPSRTPPLLLPPPPFLLLLFIAPTPSATISRPSSIAGEIIVPVSVGTGRGFHLGRRFSSRVFALEPETFYILTSARRKKRDELVLSSGLRLTRSFFACVCLSAPSVMRNTVERGTAVVTIYESLLVTSSDY